MSSRVSEVTVRNAPIASDANCELSANTAAFILSNCTSYLTRKNIAIIMIGKAANMATNVNFQPKENDIAIHPKIVNTDTSGKAIVGPNSS